MAASAAISVIMPTRPREGSAQSGSVNGRAIAALLNRVLPVYSYFQSGSSGCLISHSGRRLMTTGIRAKLYSGGGELVDHSSVHASQGSLPAIWRLTSDRSKLNTNMATPAI